MAAPQPQSGPYLAAAEAYWRRGWRGILWLPAGAKKPVPAGYTGRGGVDPSYPDIYAWTETRPTGNIALRMPHDVIGLDVDDYGDKTGATTLAMHEATHGALPPTWRSTSREARGSGIRFYRVPAGLEWPGELDGGDIEIIQRNHRYAVVWPSVHPEGGIYRWHTPDGHPALTMPSPGELPELPDAWVQALTGGRLAAESTKVTVGDQEAVGWIVQHDHAQDDTLCDAMAQLVATYLTSDLAAHSAMRNATMAIARHSEGGHHGAVKALTTVRAEFKAKVCDPGYVHPRTSREADLEWNRALTGAVGVCLGDPGPASCDCYGALTATIVGAPLPPAPEPAEAPAGPAVDTAQAAAVEAATAPGNPLLDVMVPGARFILDSPEIAPAVWGHGEEILWAKGEALMLCGPPGVGKTTLAGQLVKARLGGGSLLGFPVEATGSRVLYLAMDRPRQISRALRRHFCESDRALLDERLIVWPGPLPGDVAKSPGMLYALAQLADADTLILDSLKDAAIGITEDETGAAYNLARQKCLAKGVEVVELHHMVKRGAEGRKPTTLQDVYGSMHLTSGAGSVVILWGAGGDLVVELIHVKQPMAEVGPLLVEHDHVAGVSTISHGADLLMAIAAAGSMTARDVAAVMFSKSADAVTHNEKKKAMRAAERLVKGGLVEEFDDPSTAYHGQPSRAYRVARGAVDNSPVEGPGEGPRSFSALGDREGPRGSAISISPSPEGPGEGPEGPGAEGPRPPAPLGAVAQAVTPDRSAVHPSTVTCTSCGRRDDSYIVELLGGVCPDCAELKP